MRAISLHRCRFYTAPLADRRAFLQQQHGLSARLMQWLSLPLRAAFLLNEKTRLQAGGRTIQVAAQLELARWRQRRISGYVTQIIAFMAALGYT